VCSSDLYAARKLRASARYAPPPSGKKSPRELVESDLRGLRGSVVSALFKTINLSPFYLEEACARAGIKLAEKIEELSGEQRRALAGACKELLGEALSPRVYKEGERAFAFAPFALKKIGRAEAEEFKSFSEALDAYFESAPSAGESAASLRFEKELRELRNLLDGQERAANAFDNEAEEKRRAGDWIRANADLVERAIGEARALKRGVNAADAERRIIALSKKLSKAGVAGAELILETSE
jgi:predicted ribosome quality control (RQC) complex YloA/Tae2 family protein